MNGVGLYPQGAPMQKPAPSTAKHFLRGGVS
jgi:hypothetical protein